MTRTHSEISISSLFVNMRHLIRPPRSAANARYVIGTALIFAALASSARAQPAAIDGRELFLDPRKGNCHACHPIPNSKTIPGAARVGPDLAAIKDRYRDRDRLRAAIWDLSLTLPNTVMPPYGKHRILIEGEIDAIVRYLETL